MSPILTDEDLREALSTAAASYPESEPGELGEELAGGGQVVAWPRRRGVQLLAVAASVVVALLLVTSAVGGGVPLLNQSRPATSAAVKGAPLALPEGYANGTGGETGSTSGTTGGSGAPALSPLAAVPSSGFASLPGSAAGPTDAADSARIVETGSISLIVDDGKVVTAMGQLKVIARKAGGYIADEQTQGVGDNPSGTVTMRIPVARFAGVVSEISSKGFGAKVVSSQSSGKDVTAEYADTAAQIATLKAARGRYLTILNAARTVGEILSVQQRVDEVQGQIDRLEGARRVLANQSDLATLDVSVNQKAGATLVTERTGWSKAWHDAGHGFTSGVESLIAHSGRALLVLLVAIVIVLIGRYSWRLARRRLI